MMPRICPHEEQEIREGVWVAAVDYHFHCRCPDRAVWNLVENSSMGADE